MARIQGVRKDRAGPMVKLVYWFMRKSMKKLTGREAARGSGSSRLKFGPTSRR
jgi:hypothetical protein